MVPALGATTKWADLLTACHAAQGPTATNPWVPGCRAECVAELLSRGQPAGTTEDRVIPPTPDKAGPPLAAYYQYASAANQWAVNPGSKPAAQALAALAPDGAESPIVFLNDYRRGRALGDLRAAAAKLRGPDAMAPFAGAGAADAAHWLAAAGRIAEMDKAVPAADRLRMKFDLALASLAAQPPDVAKARALMDDVVPAAAQKVWQPSVQERVLAWTAYAHSRAATPAGRSAAAQALATVFEILRDDLAGIRTDYLYHEIVQRLDANGGKAIFGETVDAAARPAAARAYFLAGRNVRRYADDWAGVADLGQPTERERERLRLMVRLFDRAAQLDPKPEYVAWAGIAKSELPGAGDVTTSLPAGAGAAPALFLLRGIALINRAEKTPDLALRIVKWRDADAQFRNGLEQCGSREEFRDEKVLLYQRAANNCLLLANGLAALNNSNPGEVRRFVNDAKAFADKLLILDPGRLDGYDTLGCALEDMAWLLKDSDRFVKDGKYAQAVDAFSKVTTDLSTRATPWMHRGRCRFKWAQDALNQPGSTGLDGGLTAAAGADLDKVLDLAPDTIDAAGSPRVAGGPGVADAGRPASQPDGIVFPGGRRLSAGRRAGRNRSARLGTRRPC